MNKNLLMLFCATSLIFGAGVASANQEMKQASKPAVTMGEILAKKLNLTDTQLTQFEQINQDNDETIKILHQDMKNIRNKLVDLQILSLENLSKITTPTQKVELNKMLNAAKSKQAAIIKAIEEEYKENIAKNPSQRPEDEAILEQSEPVMSQEVNKNATDEELPVSDIPVVEIDEEEVMVIADPEAGSK